MNISKGNTCARYGKVYLTQDGHGASTTKKGLRSFFAPSLPPSLAFAIRLEADHASSMLASERPRQAKARGIMVTVLSPSPLNVISNGGGNGNK